MIKQAINLVAQVSLSTIGSTLYPINLAAKSALVFTAATGASIDLAKDATRRKLVPKHTLNQGKALTFDFLEPSFVYNMNIHL